MDIKHEDTMVRQIEKNLSNNINDNLFLTGRIYDNNKLPVRYQSEQDNKEEQKEGEKNSQDYPLVSYDYISTSPATISRAEYIRQAREACLRQLSNTQIYSRPYDVNYMEQEPAVTEVLDNKKAKVWGLFRNSQDNAASQEENTPQEIASFRYLIIRTVCAIVLFLSIFVIDKFEIKIGNVTHTMIQEYVTGTDTLKTLEDIVVTWLK